jgi:hypothetical protein
VTTIVGISPRSACLILGLIIYYTIVRSVAGEALKPWLGGESQPMGIVGVGTYKKKYEPHNGSSGQLLPV